jgi:GNAT superfamily N-acetyltransferase
MDETLELNRLAGRAVAAIIAGSPGREVRLTPNCALALSGEAVADLNMLLIGPDAEAERFLGDAMARVAERTLPLLVLMTPHVAGALTPVAQRLGLTPAGAIPLMRLRAETPVRLGGACEVERADDQRTIGIVGDLAAAAFDLPRAAVARTLEASLAERAGVEAFIGSSQGAPMSAVTVTRAGQAAGVWNMSTPPQHQRKGMGRALLTRVIDRYRRAGVGRFYLFATAAGRGLYESIGFETIADYPVWVLGHSTQVSA